MVIFKLFSNLDDSDFYWDCTLVVGTWIALYFLSSYLDKIK